jgi:hypothetical protein
MKELNKALEAIGAKARLSLIADVVHKMKMKTRIYSLIALCLLINADISDALPSFSWESAAHSIYPQQDMVPVIASIQFIGTCLYLEESIHVQSIGASVFGASDDTTLFMALISMDSSSSLPSGNPFTEDEVLAHTTLNIGTELNDYWAAMDISLAPGYYGLVIGSGLYGTTGAGAMPNNNYDHLFSEYFSWTSVSPYNPYDPIPLADDGAWYSGGDGYRFLMEGDVIPEPSSILLLLTGIPFLVTKKKMHNKRLQAIGAKARLQPEP